MDKKIRWIRFRWSVFGCALFLLMSSCRNECNIGGATKCDGNRIMVCEGSQAENQATWEEFRNCDDYNATCQSGITTEYLDFVYLAPTGGVAATNHSCVTEDFVCNESAGYYCTEANDYVVNCRWLDGELVAAVGVENWQDRPYCIYVEGGATFAHLEEPCEDDEYICNENGMRLRCLNQTWQLTVSRCDVNE